MQRKLGQLIALLFLLLGATVGWAVDAPKPNFIFIIFDDLSWHDLGVYGNPVIKTPHVDELASQGMKFNNAFLTTSSCTASRVSIMTGRYPHSDGTPNLGDPLPEDQQIIPSYLRQAGYYSVESGKLHEGENAYKQFDQRISGTDASMLSDWIGVLKNRPKDKPFFFWFSSFDPHLPFDPITPQSLYQPDHVFLPPYLYDGIGTRTFLAGYYNEIHRTDEHIGHVIDELKAENVLENTYIFIFSDNGAQLPAAKTTLLDAGIKTPLVIVGPGLAASKSTDSLVSALDFAPTVLDLAGIPVPPAMQGVSFQRVLRDPQASVRPVIYAEQHNHGVLFSKRAVRTRDFLYVRNLKKGPWDCLLEKDIGDEMRVALANGTLKPEQQYCFTERPPEELYDVRRDTYDLHDLSADRKHTDDLAAMRARWKAWAKQSNDKDSLEAQ
jgi:arylsulfatase